jgi:hypothetical protein
VADAREAASKLTKMGMVLDETAQKKVSKAVEEVREVAKQIVKKVSDGGVTTAEAVAGVKFTALDEARFAFFDEGETLAPVSTLPATDARSFDEEGEVELSTKAAKNGFEPGAPEANLKAAAPSTDTRSFDV